MGEYRINRRLHLFPASTPISYHSIGTAFLMLHTLFWWCMMRILLTLYYLKNVTLPLLVLIVFVRFSNNEPRLSSRQNFNICISVWDQFNAQMRLKPSGLSCSSSVCSPMLRVDHDSTMCIATSEVEPNNSIIGWINGLSRTSLSRFSTRNADAHLPAALLGKTVSFTRCTSI